MKPFPIRLSLALLGVVMLLVVPAVRGDSSVTVPMDELATIVTRLRGALARDAKAQVPADFLVVTTNAAPILRAVKEGGQSKVLISRSMLELLFRLARAKAIDDVKKHYFDEYVAKLNGHAPDAAWPELPDNDNPRYRKLEVSNGELSNFGQMVSCAVAIELSHAYLGQLDAHQAEISAGGGRTKSLKTLLTDAEWDKSFQAGLTDAVSSSYGVEGLVAIYQAIDKLPRRPEWADAFLPPSVKPRKAMRDAEKTQDRLIK